MTQHIFDLVNVLRLTITVHPQSKAQAVRLGKNFGEAMAAVVMEFDKMKPGLARCTLERMKSDCAKGKMDRRELAKHIITGLAEADLLCEELNADLMEPPPEDVLEQAVAEVERTLEEGGVL